MLTIDTVKVNEVCAGEHGSFDGGRLTLDVRLLEQDLLASDATIASVQIHLTKPGDSVRIHCCKDVVQPSVKVEGTRAGVGRRRVLEGVALVTCGPIVGFQEGIIDMSGPGAAYTPFSELSLVVLEIAVHEGTSAQRHEATLRAAGLVVAEWLCRDCIATPAHSSEALSWDEKQITADLPRIAYICMVLSQGLLHDTYLLGKNARDGLPVTLDPRIVLDGGIVSGNCVSACDKTTTFHHRNNPLVHKLLRGHGRRWNFVGLVITNQPVRLADKERSANAAAQQVRALNADGALISKEGFGNPDSDFMMILRQLEEAGIRAVGITDEFAGSDGASQSLADAVSQADAIVSSGNANERIVLPPMDKSIGPLPSVARLAGGYAGSMKDDGSLEIELQAIMGATNELGFSRLSCREI